LESKDNIEKKIPELRKDPIVGRWVIIATERGKRPSDFGRESNARVGGFCPFCYGNEDKTPPEVLSYREAGTFPNAPGWWTRVVPNKFPALMIEGELNKQGEGIYDRMNGIGAHEVVIETPDHNANLSNLDEKHIQEVIWAYRDRYIDLKRDPRFKYIIIFKNYGMAAGASLEHTHSQIIATPIIPKRAIEEMEGARRYYDYRDRCVFCDIITQERTSQQRMVEENNEFISFCPFASRFPFETWIMPKKHSSSIENLKKSEVVDFASILKNTLMRIQATLEDPPYNFIIHCSPCDSPEMATYHWHMEIMPKLTKVAGFEWGTGFYINPTPPEEAAHYLRDAEMAPPVISAPEIIIPERSASIAG
jgi:UDPglucose--hexose-1-phosphate uridylyltransferase